MAPVSFGIQVAKLQAVLKPQADPGQSTGDFPGDKGFSAQGEFMVEQDAVAGVDAVGLPVVYTDPVGIELGNSVRAPGIKRGCFGLGGFLDLAVEFRGRRLVES